MNTVLKEMLRIAVKENENVVMIDYNNEKVYSVIGDRLSIWHSRDGERISRSCFYTFAYSNRINKTATAEEPAVMVDGRNYFSI